MLRLVLLPVLLLGWAEGAWAQSLRDCDAWLVLTPASYHVERANDYHELHAGFGFEHVCGSWRGAGGVIPRNSNDDTTLYVGGAWSPLSWRELRFGGFAGVFTGYSQSLLPAAAFFGAWEGRRYGVNLLWFPPYGEDKGLWVLQVKRKF